MRKRKPKILTPAQQLSKREQEEIRTKEYREILAVADEQGGKLKNRCVFFCDEFGTLPKIESAEMMFSASRSRRLQIVPIIQSFSQLEKNYGKEGAEIIIDNTQLTIFGGFAPNSTSAETSHRLHFRWEDNSRRERSFAPHQRQTGR